MPPIAVAHRFAAIALGRSLHDLKGGVPRGRNRGRNRRNDRAPARNGVRYRKCVSRIGTGYVHEREVTNVYAAGFPSICSGGDGGGDARHGANAFGGRAGRQRSAPRRTDPGLFPRLESSRISVVRAACIGPRPDNELVALGGAAARRFGRFGRVACQQGWYQQLRPTGWRLQKSDLAAVGGSGGKEIRRNLARRHYVSEPFEPVLALWDAVHLQAVSHADDTAAGPDHNVVQWISGAPGAPEPAPSITADAVLVRGFRRPLRGRYPRDRHRRRQDRSPVCDDRLVWYALYGQVAHRGTLPAARLRRRERRAR